MVKRISTMIGLLLFFLEPLSKKIISICILNSNIKQSKHNTICLSHDTKSITRLLLDHVRKLNLYTNKMQFMNW